jgi:hypothetical protein
MRGEIEKNERKGRGASKKEFLEITKARENSN